MSIERRDEFSVVLALALGRPVRRRAIEELYKSRLWQNQAVPHGIAAW
jgi:hypothetical protein